MTDKQLGVLLQTYAKILETIKNDIAQDLEGNELPLLPTDSFNLPFPLFKEYVCLAQLNAFITDLKRKSSILLQGIE